MTFKFSELALRIAHSVQKEGPILSNYSRGRSREYRTMRLLEKAGYECFRCAGSHGQFDVIGVSGSDVVLVQCKLGRGPCPAEMEAMRMFKAPPNCRKLVHVYKPRKALPEVKEVS